LSGEIIDAGRVDGAGEFRIFWLLAFRLIAAGLRPPCFVLAFVASWNNYFLAAGRAQFQRPLPGDGGALELVRVRRRRQRRATALHRHPGGGPWVSILPVILAFPLHPALLAGWAVGPGAVKDPSAGRPPA